MKLRGGEWSRGDFLALFGVIIAVIGVIVAVLTVPGMPKFLHWDSDSSGKDAERTTTEPRFRPPTSRRVQKTRDVTSGQVNFGCDQSLPVETPVVYFGNNPTDIESRHAWANTDNVKTQNQSVVRVEASADQPSGGLKATGTIAGRDSQNILGVKNCPGGGHGELTLHVTWTEDE